ncbi:MAG: thioesterase family protein [Pseudomonadota bacterium]
MESREYCITIQVFYEDTDHSGVVYHANYLKYFERAREHVIGAETLVRLWKDAGMGFAVYKADVAFHDGAEFGDLLEIRSRFRQDSDYRQVWHQEAWRPGGKKPAVSADIHMVCLGRDRKLIPIPPLTYP